MIGIDLAVGVARKIRDNSVEVGCVVLVSLVLCVLSTFPRVGKASSPYVTGCDQWDATGVCREDVGYYGGVSTIPYLSWNWPGNYQRAGFRILRNTTPGKGMVDVRYLFDGTNGQPDTGSSVLQVKGRTDTGNEGNVTGLKVTLDHVNSPDLTPGFNTGIAVRNNATGMTPPVGTSPHFHGLFNIVGTPPSGSWTAVGQAINLENKWGDQGERLKGNDFDPANLTNPMRILGLKPESNYFGSSDGYSVDMYLVMSRDVTASHLVGAYGGLIVKNDAIAADGTGVRLGGRTAVFGDDEPDAAVRIDETWERGIDMRNASFTDSSGAIDLASGQRIRWTTPSGSVVMRATDDGKIRVYGPHGSKVIYP